jgi:N-methylhydantoinase A/oxoprolinase/acetone carboxylase beta subunit
VEISLPYLRSIALGGGSVVKACAKGTRPEISLGPESMGSFPGPACYALGGEKPTLTDAFVAAGLINPDYFLGGAKPISMDAARQTIQEFVATPLGKSVEDASRLVIDRAFEMVAEAIAHAGKDLGQDFSEYTLFAYGGNGGLIACGVAEKVGLKEVRFFALGPVFSAFGSSVSDISHVYERSLQLTSLSAEEMKRLAVGLADIKAEGHRDLLGEGIQPTGIEYLAELEISRPNQPSVAVPCPPDALLDSNKLKALLETALGRSKDGFVVDLLRVQIKKAMAKPSLVEKPIQGADSSHALKGKRQVAWGSKNGEALLYTWEALQPGNSVEGCAVLEGASSTFFVPENWTLKIDRFGNALLSRR